MFEAIIDYIARTNLFNFIIFAGIITYLFIRLDVVGGLDKGAEIIAENIDDSKTAKAESEANLQTIEDKVSHLEDEVDEIILHSENNAKLVGEQILNDANNSAENIKANGIKLIENKTSLLKNDIIKRVSVAAVDVAKKHIINELNNNYELHNKFIDESIESVNYVE